MEGGKDFKHPVGTTIVQYIGSASWLVQVFANPREADGRSKPSAGADGRTRTSNGISPSRS